MRKLLILTIIGLSLVGCGKSEAEKAKAKAEMTEIKVNRFGRERVQNQLKDARSAEFRNEVSYCGEVNAKNSFGAYTGYKRYIAPSDAIVIIQGDIPSTEFEKIWKEHCVSYANKY